MNSLLSLMNSCQAFNHLRCRDAGGAFGKMEAAHEEQYFRQLVRLRLIFNT